MIEFLIYILIQFHTLPNNPYVLGFNTVFFSPYNQLSKGLEFELQDTSLSLFFSHNNFSFGLLVKGSPCNRVNYSQDALTLYFGKKFKDDLFYGISLSSFYKNYQTNFALEPLSGSISYFLYPAFYLSRRLEDGMSLHNFRAGILFIEDNLTTPTDTLAFATRYGIDLNYFYWKSITFQWQYFLEARYFLHKYDRSCRSIQSLINYDSTFSESRLDFYGILVYSPFSNSYLGAGPSFSLGSGGDNFGLSFLGQYEFLPFAFCYLEYSFGLERHSDFSGSIERRWSVTGVRDFNFGLKFVKDFLNLQVVYSLKKNSFESLSLGVHFIK